MKKIYLLLIAAFISTQLLLAQPTSQTFNSSGTYTVPAGYSANVVIEAWGGGGGGGTNSGNAKGGGGGGAYASLTTILTAGSYTVTVGTGGGAATAGGASSFTTIVVAAGGSSTTTATGGAGGTTAASTGTILFAGGAGGNGETTGGSRAGGGGGGSANPGSNGGIGGNGNAGIGGTSGTGTGPGGTGADGDGTPDATAGTVPGGGGGGKGSNGNSQAGAAGRVVVTVNTILPVRLKSFSAVKKNNGVQLQWNAEVESNLAGYTIERSYDGSQFTGVTTVASSNSAIPVSYDYTDAAATGNVVYYRIAMNELDGKATYSRIIKVVSGSVVTQLLVYPNPVRGGIVSFITPDMAKGTYNVKIFNSNAQIVYQMKYTHSGGSLSQQLQLPAGLKPGIYNLQLNDTQVKFQQSFLLQ